MDCVLQPGPVCGSVAAIPSKSEAHRALLCAALADGPTGISPENGSRDIEATIRCLRAMGAQIDAENGAAWVTPLQQGAASPLLPCGESGSTLRFLLPVAAVLCPGARFTGEGRLPLRPLGALLAAMESAGVRFSSETLPFSLSGELRGGSFSIPGDVSSQFLSGLLFALPLLREDSEIHMTTPLESAGYVRMTLDMLRRFGISARWEGNAFFVPGGQNYHSPGLLSIGGDWSGAAAFFAAGAIGGFVSVSGLEENSVQGDREVLAILRQMGAGVAAEGKRIVVLRAPLHGACVDMRQIPDLLPVLAATAACAEGETRFTNAHRLRSKESDRIASTAALIRALGGDAAEMPDGLVVRGGELRGGVAESCGDHRIVMAAACMALACRREVRIRGAEAVDKSYPSFFEDWKRIGGHVDVVSVR